MANNDKALLLVLDLRKKEEQQAIEAVAQIRQKIAMVEQQIVQMHDYRRGYMDEILVKGQQGFGANVYMSYQGFLDKLEEIIIKQKKDLELLRQEEQQRLQFYFDKQKARKIIETLLEKHRVERIKAENKREQKMLDDFVVSSFARKS